MILAIHGGMASGKTTLLKNLKKYDNDLTIIYEDISPVIKQTKLLDKNIFEDFLTIQKKFLNHEKARIESVKNCRLAVLDYSIEEVVFHTLTTYETNHSNKQRTTLDNLLNEAKPYYVDRILYLKATDEALRQRKTNDPSRSRRSFEEYITGIHQLKDKWFSNMENVDVLDTTDMTEKDVLDFSVKWLNKQGYRY